MFLNLTEIFKEILTNSKIMDKKHCWGGCCYLISGGISKLDLTKGALLKVPCWRKSERTVFNIINSNLPTLSRIFYFKNRLLFFQQHGTINNAPLDYSHCTQGDKPVWN